MEILVFQEVNYLNKALIDDTIIFQSYLNFFYFNGVNGGSFFKLNEVCQDIFNYNELFHNSRSIGENTLLPPIRQEDMKLQGIYKIRDTSS